MFDRAQNFFIITAQAGIRYFDAVNIFIMDIGLAEENY
jgi:hypothetical protein